MITVTCNYCGSRVHAESAAEVMKLSTSHDEVCPVMNPRQEVIDEQQ